MSGSPELSGKRKSDNTTLARSPETQGNKRRKRSSVEATEDMVKETNEDIEQKAAPKKHFRFDSEEPVLPDVAESEAPVDAQQEERLDEDSSEDEAPESMDNSAQLSKIKFEAKKREEARKMFVFLILFNICPFVANRMSARNKQNERKGDNWTKRANNRLKPQLNEKKSIRLRPCRELGLLPKICYLRAQQRCKAHTLRTLGARRFPPFSPTTF
jgi:hypothetical protein